MRAQMLAIGKGGVRSRTVLLAALLVLGTTSAACNGNTTGTSTGNPTDGSKDGMDGPNLPGIPGGGSLSGSDPMSNPTPTTGEDSALGGAGYYCESDKKVLDGLDADTGLGFTAEDILAFAGGSHEEAIRWHDSFIATFGPEMGEHRVTIDVSYEDGEVRLMTPKTPSASDGDLPAIDIGFAGPGSGCTPWLEVDVHMTIHSDGDALDESGTVTLRSRNRMLASMFASPDPDELGGELAPIEIFEEGFALEQLDLNAVFTPFGVNGNLYGTFVQQSDDATTAAAGGGGPIADFGRSGCQYEGFAVGLDDEIDGATAQDALDLIERAKDVQVAWGDSTSTRGTLGFAAEGDSVCVLLDEQAAGQITLVVPGTIELATEDGTVDGGWLGELRADVGTDGAIAQAQLQLDQSGKMLPVEVNDFADTYGFANLEVGDFDQFMLQFQAAVSASGNDATSVMGEVHVNGLKFAPCAGGGTPEEQGGGSDPSNPPDAPADMPVPPSDPGASMGGSGSSDPGGGASSPGCKGADFFDVLSGALTSP